ncbi:shikimate dehydrogenase [uncultured Thermanaerothrix sp.]|uniref:shikimate dehydrogenase n=1 Tax=uncultured Thermanaerothrix sp. TaxID=1195149 RepID=UPI00262D9C70|nr:shikimate dehydrogenase [uncultured Thermanaerothrix sp.]
MTRIDTQTQIVGLIGWPLDHSLSPLMHNAAFDYLGLNWVYLAWPFPPNHLGDAVRGLRALGIRGFNITAPYKQAILPYVQGVSETARALGAINTVTIQKSPDGTRHLYGDNTDVEGFLHAVHAFLEKISHDHALILGAGGAARAVAYALCQVGFNNVTFVVRNLGRAESSLEKAQEWGFPTSFKLALSSTDNLYAMAEQTSVLVNATPVGTWPSAHVSPLPEGFTIPSHWLVIDLVYNPSQTCLLLQAKKAGALAINGLGMLVHQGALSFRAWTGLEAPVEVMYQTCLNAVHRVEE